MVQLAKRLRKVQEDTAYINFNMLWLLCLVTFARSGATIIAVLWAHLVKKTIVDSKEVFSGQEPREERRALVWILRL